ncbi:MAG: PASTA domain-containing protein [Thermoleophilaceae bacterium]
MDPTILGAGPDDLLPDESVGIYMDTDGNPATGSPIWDGADKAVITIGELGFDDPPGLGTWNGSSFDFTGGSNLTGIDAAGFSSNIDQLGIAGPTTMGIHTISLYEGIFDNYSDFAPEVGASPFAFPVSFSTAAPPPPPPAPVQTFAPTITPQQSGGKPSGFCAVPRLRGKKVKQAMAALKKAHCRYKVVKVRKKKKAGRVVSSSPSAGVLTKGIVKVKLATKARAHSAAARVALYASIEHRMSSAEAARPGR